MHDLHDSLGDLYKPLHKLMGIKHLPHKRRLEALKTLAKQSTDTMIMVTGEYKRVLEEEQKPQNTSRNAPGFMVFN